MARKKKTETPKRVFLKDKVKVTLSGCSIYGMIGEVVGYVSYGARVVYRVKINNKIYEVRDIFLVPVELNEPEEKDGE